MNLLFYTITASDNGNTRGLLLFFPNFFHLFPAKLLDCSRNSVPCALSHNENEVSTSIPFG